MVSLFSYIEVFMAIPRQKYREAVFLWLFSWTFSPAEEEMVDLLMSQLKITKRAVKEAKETYDKILPHLPEIDKKIVQHSHDYVFDRIATVEKTALRLAIYELCYEKELPPKVAIAEGIRLTKKFSVGDSSAFVNAVLDALFQEFSQTKEEEHVCLASISVE